MLEHETPAGKDTTVEGIGADAQVSGAPGPDGATGADATSGQGAAPADQAQTDETSGEGASPDESAPEAQGTTLPEPDARLLEAHDLALAALHEITAAATVGAPAGHSVEPDGVVSLRFANTMLGYPGWFWTVSLAVVDGEEPTVLEAELLPGDDALLAPEWVPWSVRLKEYQEQQRAAAAEAKAAAEAARAAGEDVPDDESEQVSFDEFDAYEDDEDADDFSEDGSPLLHAGDVDGVDIDELDGEGDDAVPRGASR